MKSIGMKTFGILAAAVAYSHAIFGIGGQWAPALGLEVKGSNDVVVDLPAGDDVKLIQGKVEGLQGFGVKLWIDFLPFVDVEASSNIQFGQYDLRAAQGADTVDVAAPLDVPLVEEKPGFARIASDVSILYPFLKLPPVVSIAKLYAGAGVTHVLATEVLNAKLAQKAVAGKTGIDNEQELANEIAKTLEKEGFSSGFGFHLVAGVKVSPPIIPIAVFANAKYHFLSSQPEAVDGSSLTTELGAALAF